jgi:hypothetical protein
LHLLFTDEAHFSRYGIISFHKQHAHANENTWNLTLQAPAKIFSKFMAMNCSRQTSGIIFLPPHKNEAVYHNFL